MPERCTCPFLGLLMTTDWDLQPGQLIVESHVAAGSSSRKDTAVTFGAFPQEEGYSGDLSASWIVSRVCDICLSLVTSN